MVLDTWGLRIENRIRRDELTYVWMDGWKFSHVLYVIIPFRSDPMGPLPKKIVVTDPMSPCRRSSLFSWDRVTLRGCVHRFMGVAFAVWASGGQKIKAIYTAYVATD